MKFFLAILFTCATLVSVAQVNFVRNPDLEMYSKCPDDLNALVYCTNWSNIKDSTTINYYQPEYYNACGNAFLDGSRHIPMNTRFYQYPHSDSGMGGFHLYYDNPPPGPPLGLPFDYRDYLQGRLFKPLVNGKSYCVSFWENMAESSGYEHNNIGAYLDNGAINKLPLPPGSEVTSVFPQIYTSTVISDTGNWVKIEGSFVANGTETHISIGNFFTNAATTASIPPFGTTQYSYYLIDDVSVVPIDAKANAGVDRWVELGKKTQIGPVEDSTARGMDCKWYHKGKLIDSGNVISVNSSSIKYAVDTYVVVQNVCGNITRDTMLLRTVPLGIPFLGGDRGGFTISPNPSNGKFVITCHPSIGGAGGGLKLFDILGRLVHQEALHFNNKEANLNLNLPSGTYILELKDEEGNVQRERLIIE